MLFDIQILRRKGLRVPRAEWAPPLRGTFRVVEMDRASNGFKRNVLKAELWASHGQARMRALASLFDPVVLPYAGDGILIAGIELESTDGGERVWEFRQAWLCSTAAGTEEDWERSRPQPLEKNKGKE